MASLSDEVNREKVFFSIFLSLLTSTLPPTIIYTGGPMKKDMRRLTIDVSKQMYQRMRLHGVKTELTLSRIVREALKEYFNRLEQ